LDREVVEVVGFVYRHFGFSFGTMPYFVRANLLKETLIFEA